MHKDEVELFLKRAKNFLDGAKERFHKEDWDLTCFMAEQSVQLITKAIILEKGGELPKTHSIRKLFTLLYQLTENKALKYDRKALLFLESAYLNLLKNILIAPLHLNRGIGSSNALISIHLMNFGKLLRVLI